MTNNAVFDIEILPNIFTVCVVDFQDYLKVFADIVTEKGTAVPLTDKLSVAEIKARLATVKVSEFEISEFRDDTEELVKFLANCTTHDVNGVKVRTDLIGFNSNKYDDLMVAAFLMNYRQVESKETLITYLYETSKKIIKSQSEDDYWKDPFISNLRNYKLPYYSIDVMRIFALDKIYKSLKQTSINLKWYELLEHDLPSISDIDRHYYDEVRNYYKTASLETLNKVVDKWDRYIIPEYIDDFKHYNRNDVFITAELTRLQLEAIRIRYFSSYQYNSNFLSSSRSKMGDILVGKFYSKYTGMHYKQFEKLRTIRTAMAFNKVIFPTIEFKTPEMKKLLEDMKRVVIYHVGKEAWQTSCIIGNTNYTIATGGIHSKDIPEFYKSDEEHKYILADVASFYPSIMVEYGIAPKHLNKNAFIKLVKMLRDERVAAKHAGKKDIAEVFKIVINAIYGKFGDEDSYLYDRMALLRTTINGQLMLLMLAEELELNGVPVYSANTDGILVKITKEQEEVYNNIIEQWQTKTRMSLDSKHYTSYIRRDINNYFAVDTKGEIARKGDYNPNKHLDDLQKGYNAPIVSRAVIDYFLEGKPVMESLKHATNILDFCKTLNIGKTYSLVETKVVNGEIIKHDIQRNSRWYISNSGVVLTKERTVDDKINAGRLVAGEYLTVLNTLDDKPLELRNISYKYYYNECMKLIEPIKLQMSNRKKSKIKKYSGCYNKLFDNEETNVQL